MKLIIQKFHDRKKINLLMVPEGHAEQVQLGELKRYALAYGLDHFDSNENGTENWTEAGKWGFNLILAEDTNFSEGMLDMQRSLKKQLGIPN